MIKRPQAIDKPRLAAALAGAETVINAAETKLRVT